MSSNKCYTEIGQVSNNFKSLTNVTFDKNKRQGKVNLYTSYLGEVSTICSYIIAVPKFIWTFGYNCTFSDIIIS